MDKRIEYDKKDLKSFGLTALVLFFACILFDFIFIALTNFAFKTENRELYNQIAMVFFLLNKVLLLAFIIFFVRFVIAIFYLRGLKKLGLIIPVDKNLYHGALSELPQIDNKPEGSRNIDSLIIMGLYLAGGATCVALTIKFWKDWNFMSGINMTLWIYGIIAAIWLVLGVLFYIQSDNSKYRDNILDDADDYRKFRISMSTGVIVLLVLLIASFLSIVILNVMVGIMFNVKAENDQKMLMSLGHSIKDSLLEVYCEGMEPDEYRSTYQKLKDGMEITEWESGDDELAKLIEEKYPEQSEIKGAKHEINEMVGRLRLQKNKCIYVKIDGEQLNVRLKDVPQKGGYSISIDYDCVRLD